MVIQSKTTNDKVEQTDEQELQLISVRLTSSHISQLESIAESDEERTRSDLIRDAIDNLTEGETNGE